MEKNLGAYDIWETDKRIFFSLGKVKGGDNCWTLLNKGTCRNYSVRLCSEAQWNDKKQWSQVAISTITNGDSLKNVPSG